jgi:mannosyltransferase
LPAVRGPAERSTVTARLPGPALTVAAAVALAAVNFLWQLGSSSLFVDEVYSWTDASVGLGGLIDQLRDNEVTPPAYFAALHEWIARLDVDSEWGMRLPSAICAILLVPVLYDLGRSVASEAAGIAAAFFGALSPLVLDYAQQVRTYAPAMLVCALAAACAIRAVDGRARDTRWALAAGFLVALAFSMHYTTVFVTAPLLALIVLTRSLPVWNRAAATAIVGVVVLALLPLMIDQLESGRQAAISQYAGLTARNVLSILGTPWDSRLLEPVWYQVLAALITTGSIMWLFARGSRAGRAIAVAAAGPVLASVVATLVSDDAIITRYTSISAPFALVAIGAAAMALPRTGRALAIAGALFVALSGTWREHDRDARFADARAAIDFVDSRWRPTDVIVTPPNDVSVNLPVRYYAGQELPPGAPVVPGEDTAGLRAAFARRSRLWVVARGDASGVLARAGYAGQVVGRYRGNLPLVLTLGLHSAAGGGKVESPGPAPVPGRDGKDSHG